MSYIKLTGVGGRVSGEKILNGLNAEGLACTGMSKTMEGENKVMTFELDDGEGASYRNTQTIPALVVKISDALERAQVYLIKRSKISDFDINNHELSMVMPGDNITLNVELIYPVVMDPTAIVVSATSQEPPQSSPARGSLAWAEQILAES